MGAVQSDCRIEVCAGALESALVAQEAGAYRVELCAGMPEGGTTPSYGEIALARKMLDIKLHVIIRPRGGDFLYSPLEQDIMLRDIEAVRALGVDGIVVGCLTADADVDCTAMGRIMEAANGMSVTFHRAFDMVRDPMGALEKIISLGCGRILTSGQKNHALDGCGLIARLVAAAAGRIVIMPGSGVTAENISQIAARTGAKEFHLSGRTEVDGGMRYRNTQVSMGGTVNIDEYKRYVTDRTKIEAAIAALRGVPVQFP